MSLLRGVLKTSVKCEGIMIQPTKRSATESDARKSLLVGFIFLALLRRVINKNIFPTVIKNDNVSIIAALANAISLMTSFESFVVWSVMLLFLLLLLLLLLLLMQILVT